MSTTLYTIHGEPFTVDDEDAPLVERLVWRMANHALPHLKPKHVLVARIGPNGCANRDIFLRHLIMGSPPSPQLEAFNIRENPWCMEKSNLTWLGRATIRHWTARSESLSGYRGVTQRYEGAPWTMKLGGKRGVIQEFSTAEEAARAYDQAARTRFGAWAKLNFPRPDDPVREGLSMASRYGSLIATDGTVIETDRKFLPLLHRHSWQLGEEGYWTSIGKTMLPLAYLILGRPGPGGRPRIDWIDGNTTNCTLSNLRWRYLGESQFRGVSRTKETWTSKLRFQGETLHLGTHETPEKAAQAYDAVATVLHGPKAHLNFPKIPNESITPR